MSKYLMHTAEEMKAAVSKLAVEMTLPIDLYIADERAEKQNILAACYNDGIRCFAEMLMEQIDESAEKQK